MTQVEQDMIADGFTPKAARGFMICIVLLCGTILWLAAYMITYTWLNMPTVTAN